MYFYIIYSTTKNRYYIGITDDLNQRLNFHNFKEESKGFSKIASDWEFKLTYRCKSKEQASLLERFIKKQKSRKFNERLINSPSLLGQIILDQGF